MEAPPKKTVSSFGASWLVAHVFSGTTSGLQCVCEGHRWSRSLWHLKIKWRQLDWFLTSWKTFRFSSERLLQFWKHFTGHFNHQGGAEELGVLLHERRGFIIKVLRIVEIAKPVRLPQLNLHVQLIKRFQDGCRCSGVSNIKILQTVISALFLEASISWTGFWCEENATSRCSLRFSAFSSSSTFSAFSDADL